MTGARDLHQAFVHLGLGATVVPQPDFTDMAWYGDYIARNGADGAEGRLVSLYRFSEPWDSWEMHPQGAELVVCTTGTITLIQERPGEDPLQTVLSAGQYAINPPGVWHTADVDGEAEVLFITSGIGTEHRPRTAE